MTCLRPYLPPALRFNTVEDAVVHFEAAQAGLTPDWSRVVQPHLRLQNPNRLVPNPAYEEAQYELGYMVCDATVSGVLADTTAKAIAKP